MYQPRVSVSEVYGSTNVKRMMHLFGYNDQTQMKLDSRGNQPQSTRPVIILDRNSGLVDWADFRSPIYQLDIGEDLSETPVA